MMLDKKQLQDMLQTLEQERQAMLEQMRQQLVYHDGRIAQLKSLLELLENTVEEQ